MAESEKPKLTFALIDTEPLGDAAKLFIEKVGDAIGGFARPWQIRRIAEAEADAKMIHAQEEIRITTLQKRAAQRWLNEETQKQENMEAITAKAVPEIREDAKPDKIENDWLVNFFDKARLTSDEDMQKIWAKILAGEANSPGKFAKRTVDLMASLDKADAEKFQTLCRFNWTGLSGYSPIVFDSSESIYIENGITWTLLQHLEDIGLASVQTLTGLEFGHLNTAKFDPKNWFQSLFFLGYGTENFVLYPGAPGKRFPIGKVALSRAGNDLASVCKTEPVLGFAKYVVSKWEAAGAKIKQLNPNESIRPEDFGIIP